MKWDRLWIFFVIVAVGLALSWGKVGQNTEKEVSKDPFELLRVEPACDLRAEGCAAYGSELALVAKAAALSDDSLGMYFRLVGLDMAGISGFEVALHRDGVSPQPLAVLRRQQDWQVVLTGPLSPPADLRVRFETAAGRYAAEYPLRLAEGQ